MKMSDQKTKLLSSEIILLLPFSLYFLVFWGLCSDKINQLSNSYSIGTFSMIRFFLMLPFSRVFVINFISQSIAATMDLIHSECLFSHSCSFRYSWYRFATSFATPSSLLDNPSYITPFEYKNIAIDLAVTSQTSQTSLSSSHPFS